MTNHLQKRGARYYVRRKIPQDLIEHYGGRKEVCRALGTSDPIEARRRVREESVRLDQEWEQVRRSLSATAGGVRQVREYVIDPVSNPASIIPTGRRIAHDPASPGRYELLPDGDTAVLWPNGPDDPVHARRLEDARQFLNALLVARTLEEERAARAEEQPAPPVPGFPAGTPSVPVPDAPRPRRRDNAPGSASVGHLAALVEKWARERKPQADTQRAYERCIDKFYDYVGRISVRAITRAHVVQFKDRLLESGQSARNADNYLTNLRTLLNYAVANLQAEYNAADGIKVGERRNAKGARLPFDLPALRAIFSGPVYTEGFRPDHVDWSPSAAYWFPLVALHTGARLEEIAQLSPDDVYQEMYFADDETERTAWVIRFTGAGEGQGVKTAGSERRIPVHAALVERGFTDLAQSRRGQKRIFSMTPDPRGREGSNWGKWFGKYLRGTCSVTDPRMTFHSFRHSFKDICRTRGIAKDVHDALTGHAGKDVADTVYGGLTYPLAPLVDAVARIRVPGLTLPGAPPGASPA